ncbi:MAG: hypothetical protein ACAI37_06080 [Chthoniobacter sp.]
MGGGEIAYWLLWKRRQLSLRNLTRALKGQKTRDELRALNRLHFRRLAANLLCCFKIDTMSPEEILKRVTVEKPQALEVPPEGQRTGWVAMISHLSNWELFGSLTALFPDYQFGAVYQKLANPFIDQYLREMRAQAGIMLFERKEGFLRCIDFLRDGGAIGVLVDQSAGYAGLWTPLFGRLASCSTLAASLAIRTEVPIVPIAIYTSSVARWTVVGAEPIQPGADDMEPLTARINRQLEQQILRSPADWLWAHNRWKPLRPHFLFARDQRRTLLPPDCDRQSLEPFRLLLESPATPVQAEASLPAIRAIKEGRPDLRLTILVTSPLAEFWSSVPEVDEVMRSGDSKSPSLARIRALRDFDAAMVFTPSLSRALELWLAGVPIRVGPRGVSGSWCYNQFLPPPESEEEDPVLTFLRIAQSVGANINAALAAHSPHRTRI